jgi:lysophospholipid acyltransferase (LPLAT)-like uncharacterized protein
MTVGSAGRGAGTGFRKRLKHWVTTHVAPFPGALFVKLLWRTLRVQYLRREISESLRSARKPYIMAFWHGTLLMMIYAYTGDRLTFLVSWHRDGELVTRVMGYFGIQPTRGSSTRGGAKALQQILRKVRGGFDVAFTPDGPKGPARKAQMGIVHAARLAGVPIVPVGFAARRCTHLRSWDAFQIPWPFTRVAFCYGDPVAVPKSASEKELEVLRKKVEEGLERATLEAERAVGLCGDRNGETANG